MYKMFLIKSFKNDPRKEVAEVTNRKISSSNNLINLQNTNTNAGLKCNNISW